MRDAYKFPTALRCAMRQTATLLTNLAHDQLRELDEDDQNVMRSALDDLDRLCTETGLAARAAVPAQAGAAEAVHQWRMRTPDNNASWHDAPKDWAYERVDGNYEARTLYRHADAQEPVVGDLAALVAQLVRALRKAAPDHDLPEKALDYLKRKDLLGSPLRAAAQPPAQGELRQDQQDALADLRKAVQDGATDEWLLGFLRGYPFNQAVQGAHSAGVGKTIPEDDKQFSDLLASVMDVAEAASGSGGKWELAKYRAARKALIDYANSYRATAQGDGEHSGRVAMKPSEIAWLCDARSMAWAYGKNDLYEALKKIIADYKPVAAAHKAQQERAQ